MRGPTLSLALIFVLGFCDRDRQDRPAETTTTGVTLELVPADLARDRVVAAQCMREQLCVEVGLTREISTQCAPRAQTARCDRPIDGHLLEDCLQAIYNAPCATPLEARTSSIEACKAKALCPER